MIETILLGFGIGIVAIIGIFVVLVGGTLLMVAAMKTTEGILEFFGWY